jgi:hypothetical protein
MFCGDEGGEPLERPLDKGLAGVQNVEELLGKILAAHGPETAADAAGHDHHVMMFVHTIIILSLPG